MASVNTKSDHGTNFEFPKLDEDNETASSSSQEYVRKDSWKSPSDHIIGLVDSMPPYTSKVLRSKTHFGILAKGEKLIQEYDKFNEHLDILIKENEAACQGILEHQLQCIMNKVKTENDVILAKKTKIFLDETLKFYEKSLQELEDHLRSELHIVIIDMQANIKKEFNTKISNKLETEKKKLDSILKEKVMYEVHKMRYYYQLLIANVLHFNNKLKNRAIIERNDTFRAFLRQTDVENITNTMYVLCEERKKCKARKFIVQNHQMSEISAIKINLKNKLDILDDLKKNNTGVYAINKNWEEKISKIMKLFLKFIGFSLKLLPEQVTFLLDLEKMVVLQLNELKKSSLTAPSILIEKNNIFNFEKTDPIKIKCNKKPFEIIGDLSEDIPTQYSSETIPSNVDLPYIRVGREFIYAKCQNFEEVKEILGSQQCKCRSNHEIEFIQEQVCIESSKHQEKSQQPNVSNNESSIEHLIIDDIHQLKNCPVPNCNVQTKCYSLTNLESFIKFNEDNFKKLKSITKELRPSSKIQMLNPADIVFGEIPFAETKERCNNIETQYSSQETYEVTATCPCVNRTTLPSVSSKADTKSEQMKLISSIMQERKNMLLNLVHEHPQLLNIVFTEENYNLPF